MPEQRLEDATEGFLCVGVAGALSDEDGDGHAHGTVAQQCDLVLDFAGAGAPAALEVELPTAQVQLAQSQQMVSTDLVTLFKSLGGGWQINETTKKAKK